MLQRVPDKHQGLFWLTYARLVFRVRRPQRRRQVSQYRFGIREVTVQDFHSRFVPPISLMTRHLVSRYFGADVFELCRRWLLPGVFGDPPNALPRAAQRSAQRKGRCNGDPMYF